MKLSTQEIDKMMVVHAGTTALKRLASGIRLNHPETVAVLTMRVMDMVRTGLYSVAQLMDIGRRLIGKNQVIPGIEAMLEQVQVEATFLDGTKLVTIHEPISLADGDLHLLYQGTFIQPPSLSSFPSHPEDGLVPGEVHVLDGDVHLNADRPVTTITVSNLSDRPVQVGSHYHFIETNSALSFDRKKSYGKRLNIAAGTSVRFEPGESKVVTLVPIAGNRVISGGNRLCSGPCSTNEAEIDRMIADIVRKGFHHKPETNTKDEAPPTKRRKSDSKSHEASHGIKISRQQYAAMYGPTTGDVVRLADTNLHIRVERDFTRYGDECKFGGGKTIREGMGQATGYSTADQLDTVITNALIVDHTGIFKADIGVKNGLICGIGKAGNPDVMEGVDRSLIVGVNTEVIAAEGLIVTAGGVDSHVHFICPQICDTSIGSGLTTLIGGGTGPASGTTATTCTPSPFHLKMMMKATDQIPLNFGFTGKGNTSDGEGLVNIIEAGAVGLKLHEDWGTTPTAIDYCLSVADREDVQVTIHTDTLNESCCVEGSISAIAGRTIHTYHSEGAGGGHAPDIITVCGQPNVIPSSTNPTRPLTKNTIDEHLDMLMVCHHLDASIPEDVSFAESRIRKETIAAEDVLHDMGAISIISSDSQAMGRVGEVILRTWQTAHKMKEERGQLPEDKQSDIEAENRFGTQKRKVQTDNFRVRRYVAKYTINPCIAHGISDIVGSIEVGKLADIVLWKPSFFGVKPELVVKGGHIAWAQMGDANASIPTPEPVVMRPMFAARGAAAAMSSLMFVSRKCVDSGKAASYELNKQIHAVSKTRGIGKRDMKLNDSLPQIEVDPETYKVKIDGEPVAVQVASSLPMTQRYFLF